jgi:hypothetical protein
MIGMTNATVVSLNENEPVKEVVKKLSGLSVSTGLDDEFKKQVITHLEYILEVLAKIYDGVEGLYDEDGGDEEEEEEETKN